MGVKHSSMLARLAQAPDGGGLVRRQVVQDHEEPVAAGAGGPDRLQRGQGVIGALALSHDAPELVIGEGVAAVEIADAVGAVVGRRQPGGLFCAKPRRLPWTGRIDSGPNWSKAKHRSGKWLVTYSIRSSLASRSGSVDSFQVRVRWKLMPRGVQDLPQPLPPTRTGRSGWLAKYAASLRTLQQRERQAQLLRPGGGRRDDHLNILVTDPAGTASRPLRVQRRQALGVEQMDHIADGVLIRGHQPGDRGSPVFPTPTP